VQIKEFIKLFTASVSRKFRDAKIHQLDGDKWYIKEKIDINFLALGLSYAGILSLNINFGIFFDGILNNILFSIFSFIFIISIPILFLAAIAILALIIFTDFDTLNSLELDYYLIEMIVEMYLLLFITKCFFMAKEGGYAIIKHENWFIPILGISTIVIVKTFYTLVGFTDYGPPGYYPSGYAYLLTTIMVFSLQQYLLYYINGNNEKSEIKMVRDHDIGAPYVLGSISLFLLVYILDLPQVYYIISSVYVLITYLMNSYKSIHNVGVDLVLICFLAYSLI